MIALDEVPVKKRKNIKVNIISWVHVVHRLYQCV